MFPVQPKPLRHPQARGASAVSAPEVIANVSRGWNREPAAVAVGGPRTRISAALWCGSTPGPQEVEAVADHANYIIAVNQMTFRASMSIDGKLLYERFVHPNSVQIVRPGEHPTACIRDSFASLHIYLPAASLVDCLALEGVDAGGLELRDPMATVDLGIGRLSAEIRSEMNVHEALSGLRLDALGQDLAIQLIRRHSNLTDARWRSLAQATGGLASWQERRCTEYLRAHLGEDVDLKTLAAVANLSPFHFARMFKKTTGLPPHRYQVLLRLERAKEMLATTDMSIVEIALAVGYDAPQTLARLFRRELDTTPSAYRRERCA